MKRQTRLLLVSIFIIAVFLIISSAYSADPTIPAKVKDLSDRKYEQALVELFDNAKEAIVISMYSVNPSAGEKKTKRETT